MNNLLEALSYYFFEATNQVKTHLFQKKVPTYLSIEKTANLYFKKGDRVETKDKHVGTVWRVYVKIKTGKPEGCSILWDTTYNGEKITPIVPVIDKSPKFNPVIRKLLE